MISEDVLDALREAVGPSQVRSGDALAGMDPGWHPDNLGAGLVVSPGSTREVSAVLRTCSSHGVGVVPHGGRTGLVGGATSLVGEVVVSTARMNRILDIDPVSRVAVVEAGVTLQALQDASRVHRLEPGIDIPARGSATLGGLVSTNAGGILAFRNGVMRHQVLGLEAVLPDGSIFSDLTRVVKNATGYDLKHMFIGSEGTLGIVTRVAVKLDGSPTATATALFGLPSVSAVLDVIRMGLDSPSGTLRAAEALWRDFLLLTSKAQGFSDASVQVDAPLHLLLMLGGSDGNGMREALERMFEAASERYPEASGTIAASIRQERDLWSLREDTDAIYRAFPGAPSFDVSVPLSQVDTYVGGVLDRLSKIDGGIAPFVFGHLADGNLHIVLDRAGPSVPKLAAEIEAVIYGGLRETGGAFSAEHGIGTKRTGALASYSDPVKLTMMRRLKSSFDRHGIANRGKVVN